MPSKLKACPETPGTNVVPPLGVPLLPSMESLALPSARKRLTAPPKIRRCSACSNWSPATGLSRNPVKFEYRSRLDAIAYAPSFHVPPSSVRRVSTDRLNREVRSHGVSSTITLKAFANFSPGLSFGNPGSAHLISHRQTQP